MSDPIIHLTHQAEVKLTAWSIATHGREFSGLGLIEKEGNVLHVVDVDLLGVGSLTYTEFGFERQRLLPPDPRRKLWFHRHPLGNGVPGPHNWSGRDNRTAELEPFGVPSQLVQWSCSIVLTPKGWVGRVDFYLPTLRTFHCVVEPNLPGETVVNEASAMIDENLRRFVDDLLQEFEAQQRGGRTYIHQEYTDGDFDVYQNAERAGMFCNYCGVELQDGLEIEDLLTGEMLPVFECPDCGNQYILTKEVRRLARQPKGRSWTQSFWNWANGRK